MTTTIKRSRSWLRYFFNGQIAQLFHAAKGLYDKDTKEAILLLGKPILLLIALFSTVLMGCQITPSDSSLSDVEKIELLKVEGFTNTAVLKTITEKEQIEAILIAIETSEQISGILNVTAPDYSLKLYYKNSETKTYYLWLSKLGSDYNGMIMDTEDTHTGFTLDGMSAKNLYELIP